MAYESKDQDWKAEFIYLVDIDIKKGIGLAKADTLGSSDGFVKVQCLNRKFKTIVIKDNLNPEWNAHTQFQFYQEPEEVLFRVLDWNRANKDKPIGDYTLDIRGFFDPDSEGFSGCVKLNNVKRGEIEICVKCKRLAPFEMLGDVQKCVQKLTNCKDEMRKCRQHEKNCKDQARTYESEIAAIKPDCDRIQKRCDAKQREYSKCRSKGREYDEECEQLERECQELQKQYELKDKKAEKYEQKYKKAEEEYKYQQEKLTDVDKYALVDRCKKYAQNIAYEGDDDDEYEPDYDDNLYGEMIIAYKTRYKEVSKYNEDDDEYETNREAADGYLQEIYKWYNDCNQEYQKKKDNYLVDYDLTDGGEINFFSKFYYDLCKYFFCIHIVGATLDEFADEIKKALGGKKKVNKCCFDDLKGMDDSTGIWEILYTNFDFVINDLDKVFNRIMKKKPLKALCNRSITFIKDCYVGNYPRFCKLISYYICMIMYTEELPCDDPSILLEDAMGILITILNDTKNFALKLFQSLEKNYDPDQCDEPPEDIFEQLFSLIIVRVCFVEDKIGEILNDKDKKQIHNELQCVLAKCGEYSVDKFTIDLIKDFFNYFFSPGGSGCCQCDGDKGFFGMLFGSLCRQ